MRTSDYTLGEKEEGRIQRTDDIDPEDIELQKAWEDDYYARFEDDHERVFGDAGIIICP